MTFKDHVEQVIRRRKMSYQVKLIGSTTQAFVPTDGRAIAV